MKTIKEFRDHFSAEEIKLLKEIVCGKLEFSVLEEEIKDFYDGENFEEYMQSIVEDDKYNLVGDDFIDYQLNKYGTIGTEGSAYDRKKK